MAIRTGIYCRLHGSEELKQRYLPGLVDGSVAGTMCLTEPQCGTDLGLVRTKAEPNADGSYKITGSKIFISAGEHDLTENILHLLLARLPDESLRTVALWKMEGYTNAEIAARLGCVTQTVERKLRAIRTVWSNEAPT